MQTIQFKTRKEIIEQRLLEYFKTADSNKLPSEEDLAQMLGVSRTTVRAAMNDLVQKGYLNKRKKKGNYFLKSVMETASRMDLFSDFPQLIRENGYEPVLKRTYLKTALPDAVVAQKLSCAPGEQVHHFLWEFMADGEPAIVVFFQIPERLLSEIPPDNLLGEQELKTDFFALYCDQDLSHYIAKVRSLSDERASRIFGLPAETSYIAFVEDTFNIHDQCVSVSEIFIHPKKIEFNLVSLM